MRSSLFILGYDGLTIEAFITRLQFAQLKTVLDLRERFGIYGKNSASQNPTLSAPLGLNLLAGCLMNSGSRPATPKKVHTNQHLANPLVLAGYLMGLPD